MYALKTPQTPSHNLHVNGSSLGPARNSISAEFTIKNVSIKGDHKI